MDHNHGDKIGKFNSADELDDFSSLFPAGTNSALSRCLTEEIWNEYKDKKMTLESVSRLAFSQELRTLILELVCTLETTVHIKFSTNSLTKSLKNITATDPQLPTLLK